MTYPSLYALAISSLLCAGSYTTNTVTDTYAVPTKKHLTRSITNSVLQSNAEDDETQIRTLIIKMLKWSDNKTDRIDLLPTVIKNNVCTGFDLEQVDKVALKLKSTGMFAEEFIKNYQRIIRTLDRKIKEGQFGKWSGMEIPPFIFDSDVNPWCSCQDNYPWENVTIKVIKLGTAAGRLEWMWGKSDVPDQQEREKTAEPFRVVKENGKWKIAYLRGFDHDLVTKGVKY